MAANVVRSTRRGLTAVALVSFALAFTPSTWAQSDSLSLLTWGGVYLKHLQASSLLAFGTRNEHSVRIVDYPRQVLPRQLLDTLAAPDLAVVEQADARQGCEQGWLQPLALLSLPSAPDATPALRDFVDDSLETCAVPLLRWSQVLLHAPAASAQALPSRAQDFFDLERFPGQRVAVPGAAGLLEFALLADGVAPGAVYATLATAEGAARAMRQLRRLAGQVRWVDDGNAVIAALASGAAVMGFSSTLDWNHSTAGRGVLQVLWDAEILHTDMLVIPTVNRNPQTAWALLQHMTASGPQSLLAQLGGYAPVRKSALDRLSLDLQSRLPGQARPSARRLEFDGGWWRDHGGQTAVEFAHWFAAQDWSAARSVP